MIARLLELHGLATVRTLLDVTIRGAIREKFRSARARIIAAVFSAFKKSLTANATRSVALAFADCEPLALRVAMFTQGNGKSAFGVSAVHAQWSRSPEFLCLVLVQYRLLGGNDLPHVVLV